MNLSALFQQHPLAYLLFLNRLDGIGTRRWLQLTEAVKIAGLTILIEGSPAELAAIGFPKEALGALFECRIQSLEARNIIAGVEKDLSWLARPNNSVLIRGEADFPPLLNQIYDPPAMLFCKGNTAALFDPSIAVVGARNPTLVGREKAFQFAECFAQAGVMTVSGLALGIDAQAHRGALAGGGTTVAVLAGGLEQLYPKQHRGLADQVCEQGALISEMPVDVPATPTLFPRRNRIISGLSLATVIIEAAMRSGSLVTARYAMEQSRDVFAMPGSVLNPLSEGCHSLIRQGAGLVENGSQVIEALGFWSPAINAAKPAENLPLNIDPEASSLLNIMGFEPIAIDTLACRSGLAIPILTQHLLELELEGQIQSCAGGFIRTA